MMSNSLSRKKSSPFKQMVAFTLGKNKAIIILGCVLSLLVMPVFPLCIASNLEEELSGFMGDYIIIGLAIGWGIAAALTALLTLINMNFMHNKNASDLFFALPITRSKLYLSRLIASLLGGIAPIIIPLLSSVIFKYAFNISYLSVGGIFFFGAVSVITAAVIAIVCGFFMVFTGRTFDSILALLVINIGLPIIALIVILQTTSTLYGIPDNAFDAVFYLGFSPISASAHWIYIALSGIENSFSLTNSISVIGLIWAALSAVMLTVSVLFSRARKCESAGNAYSHFIVPIIITSVVSFIAAFGFGALFTLNTEFTLVFAVFAVIGALLSSIIIGAIFSRGFKSVKQSLLIGAGAVAIYLAFFAVITTGAFGYESRVPSINDIESATYILNTWEDGAYADDLASTTYTEQADIQQLLLAHKGIVKNKRLNKYGGDNIAIAYRLKNGVIIRREFKVDSTLQYNNFEALAKNKNRMNNLKLDPYFVVAPYVEISLENGSWVYGNLNREETEKLLSAYISDSKNLARSYYDDQHYYININDLCFSDDGAELLKIEKYNSPYKGKYLNFAVSSEFLETKKQIDEILPLLKAQE